MLDPNATASAAAPLDSLISKILREWCGIPSRAGCRASRR